MIELPPLKQSILTLRQQLEELPVSDPPADQWADWLTRLAEVTGRLGLAESYAVCLAAADVHAAEPRTLRAEVALLISSYQSLSSLLESRLAQISEDNWQDLLQHQALAEHAFSLTERRHRGREKSSPAVEDLAAALSVDGWKAWETLYFSINGHVQLSIGNTAHQMKYSRDPHMRKNLFDRFQNAWAEQAEQCAAALNHLTGFCITLQRHRQKRSLLADSLLHLNRLSEDTLHAMWQAINQFTPRLTDYLQRKADSFGLKRLRWCDLYTPYLESDCTMEYDEAVAFLLEQFHRISPRLADLARRAVTLGWIDAEPRKGKRVGAFCANFALIGESRIIMTYRSTHSDVLTLAHELGHAYHNHAISRESIFNQYYSLSMAETASTFAEMAAADGLIQAARSSKEQVRLLDEKLQKAVTFLMEMNARFRFETRFHDSRQKGLVSVDQLNALMVHAQKESFHHALDEYDPCAWAHKHHFYLADVPYYNYPYTFGYLFSQGLHLLSREEEAGFADRYERLLRDSGRMPLEELSRQHLGLDLTRPEFWEAALQVIGSDLDHFLQQTS